MQFVLYTCYKFRLLLESVLIRLEMDKIASYLRLLEAKNGLSSISICQVGTCDLANIAGMVHSKLEKLLVPATLPLVTASVALPLANANGSTASRDETVWSCLTSPEGPL
jgi:hypothetical protein